MITAELDLTHFDKILNEYRQFSKRTPADIINSKLYYISRNATVTTKAADKSKIRSTMEGPAKSYPTVPLAAILVNAQLGKKGEKGFTGAAMKTAVEKLIKKRNAAINFVRAGWKNSIKILESYLKTTGEFSWVSRNSGKGGSLKADRATMRKKTTPDMGSAIPANIRKSGNVYGEIQNSVGGTSTLTPIKTVGLQKAIDRETQSMKDYVERKLNAGSQKFNR